jgi:hypothetical protein
VLYEVSCVQLDLLSVATPVPTRVRQVGTPDVRGDVSPPSIDTLAPVRGAAGTPVEFTGSNLTGRPVTVTLGDAVLVAITDATGDTVSAGIPSDLSAGTYELRVDVSTDFRRVFLFEVVS